MSDFSFAERVSLQSAQMLIIASRADDPEMRDQLFDFARRMARQARAQAFPSLAPVIVAEELPELNSHYRHETEPTSPGGSRLQKQRVE
jgi:hypothetical protein